MSDSVRPHKRQPTRLPRLWDSPGKNTGVGCHFLLQCMKVKSESEVAQSCPTLSDPMDCRLPGSSIHGIFQSRVVEWVAIAFSGRTLWKVLTHLEGYSKKEPEIKAQHLDLDRPGFKYLIVVLICISLIISGGEGNGTPLQYSCLENPMDAGGW